MEGCGLFQQHGSAEIEIEIESNVGDYDDTPLFTRKIPCTATSSKPSNLVVDPAPQPTDYPKYNLAVTWPIYCQTTMFATLLEDTVTELRILDQSNNVLRIIKVLMDKDSLLRKKYSFKPAAVVLDEIELIDTNDLDSQKYKLNKFVADRKLVTDLMLDTYLDLALKENYATLMEANADMSTRIVRYQLLQAEVARKKVMARECAKQLRQQRNIFKSTIYQADQQIEIIQSTLQDAPFVKTVRERYIDNWQNAQSEQNTQVISNREEVFSDAIQYYRKQFDCETRVHTEVELVTNLFITETLEKIDNWMEKYDKDMEKVELKIQLKKINYNMQQETRAAMEKTLEVHQREIDNWVSYKDEREKARVYRETMNNAATAVQAWWRGLLVRLQLGPYKPQLRKPGKADKKKK